MRAGDGSRNAVVGRAQWLSQRLLARRLPVEREVVIPRAGHWLANEQDEMIAKEIVAFAG